MRAADITINEEYVACTANPYSHKTWQDKRRVRVLAAPVAGWERSAGSWSDNYRGRPVHGKVNEDPNARKDHALVMRLVRDREAEQAIKYETFDDIIAERHEYLETLDQDERAAYQINLMQSITVDPIWIEQGEDRVPLRDIKAPWADYQDWLQKRAEAEAKAKSSAEALEQALSHLNDQFASLGIGLEVKRDYFSVGFGANRRKVNPLVIKDTHGKGQHGAVAKLSKLLNEVAGI